MLIMSLWFPDLFLPRFVFQLGHLTAVELPVFCFQQLLRRRKQRTRKRIEIGRYHYSHIKKIYNASPLIISCLDNYIVLIILNRLSKFAIVNILWKLLFIINTKWTMVTQLKIVFYRSNFSLICFQLKFLKTDIWYFASESLKRRFLTIYMILSENSNWQSESKTG